MPTFCRHNHLIQNCPICSREQQIEMRPVVSSGAPGVSAPRSPATRSGTARPAAGSGSTSRLRVRRLVRGVDDGYHSPLVPGLKSSEDAERLAEELAFASDRLARLEADPPGLYAQVADPSADLEERTWLAFLIAYLYPLDDDDPFAAIAAVRTPWQSAEDPALDEVRTGPRTAHGVEHGARTITAYRAWAARSGSQAAAFTGEPTWNPERRFARVFERLALPGFPRDARFELLVTLGRLGCYELQAGALQLGAANTVTVAAKRALGIGDTLLLERRAAKLATACGLPLDALDLGLHNWGTGERATGGLGPSAEPDPDTLATVRGALSL